MVMVVLMEERMVTKVEKLEGEMEGGGGGGEEDGNQSRRTRGRNGRWAT